MKLIEYFTQQVYLQTAGLKNSKINFIEINKHGKIKFLKSLNNYSNENYLNNSSLEYFTIYFFKMFRHYFIMYPTLQSYYFALIKLESNKPLCDIITFSSNDIRDSVNPWIFSFELLINQLGLYYRDVFDFNRLLNCYNLNKPDIAITLFNCRNQVQFFYKQFNQALLNYAQRYKKHINLIKYISFDQYLQQNFYFNGTKYLHVIINCSSNKLKKYWLYSSEQLSLYNINLIDKNKINKSIEINRHYLYKYDNFYVIYSLQTNTISIVRFTFNHVQYILYINGNDLNNQLVNELLHYAFLFNRISNKELNWLLKNWKMMCDIQQRSLYPLL